MRTKVDWVLFSVVTGLMALGLVMVYSASAVSAPSNNEVAAHYFLARQAVFAVAAAAILLLLARLDYRKLASPQVAFAALSITGFLLIAVYFADPVYHRWFKVKLPVFRINLQPSELAKPALILFLAWFLSEQRDRINHKHTLWPTAITLAALAGGVLQADLGTAVVLAVVATVIMLLAGLSWRHCSTVMMAGALAIALAIAWKPYRLLRLLLFYDKDYTYLQYVDPNKKILEYAKEHSPTKDTEYQGMQSVLAIGSGGVWGVGLGQSHQKLLYLPEAHTDFIYAIIAEELGFIGAGLVLAAFLVILWRGYRLFLLAPDDFGRFLAAGATTAIVFQAMLNMSVVLNLFPTKGIPLPMLSYGGTSLLSTMIMAGMILSVSHRTLRQA